MAPVLATAKFQNISCYCLTLNGAERAIELNRFQNISCYCLTDVARCVGIHLNDFKTSHVIV